MNLYLRYFDKETLVHNVDEALDFLASIPEIGLNEELEMDLRDYANSEVYYPKRYKVRPRVYFIVIKTEAATMLDFKQKKAFMKEALISSVLFLCQQLVSMSIVTLISLCFVKQILVSTATTA